MISTIISIPKNLRCLAVDDSTVRLQWFIESIPGCTVASSNEEALHILDYSEPFDLIFLDHDAVPVLVDQDEPDYRRLTFWRVAEYLDRNEYNGMVVVHSANPIGAKRMGDLLKKHAIVHIKPFGSFGIQTVAAVEG